MKYKEHFTPEELAKTFNYDPATGVLTWAVQGHCRHIGEACGFDISEGYRGVGLKGKQMPIHRVAWAIYYGEWPKGQIDHINRDRKDNRITNLRVVSASQNRVNSTSPKPNGLLGVTRLRHGRWQAQSGIGGVMRYLGTFDTKEQAHQAYVQYVTRTHADYLPKEDQ